jgi:hypothetical protein
MFTIFVVSFVLNTTLYCYDYYTNINLIILKLLRACVSFSNEITLDSILSFITIKLYGYVYTTIYTTIYNYIINMFNLNLFNTLYNFYLYICEIYYSLRDIKQIINYIANFFNSVLENNLNSFNIKNNSNIIFNNNILENTFLFVSSMFAFSFAFSFAFIYMYVLINLLTYSKNLIHRIILKMDNGEQSNNSTMDLDAIDKEIIEIGSKINEYQAKGEIIPRELLARRDQLILKETDQTKLAIKLKQEREKEERRRLRIEERERKQKGVVEQRELKQKAFEEQLDEESRKRKIQKESGRIERLVRNEPRYYDNHNRDTGLPSLRSLNLLQVQTNPQSQTNIQSGSENNTTNN